MKKEKKYLKEKEKQKLIVKQGRRTTQTKMNFRSTEVKI